MRVPKQIGQPQLQVVSQSSVPVKMYLINEAGHVLAKKENFLADIVSGALNLSFGINPSATCLAGGDPDYDCEGGLQVLAGLSGTNVREKWLQAIYGSGTIAVKHCYQAATQAVAPCTASGSLSGARLIVVQFQVQNQSGQTVDLSFAVKAGSAFYSQYAQLALRVAPDSVQVEHIQDGAISTEKLQDGAVTDSKIQSVSSSKLSGVLDWSKLPAPLSALNACSDGQILVRNNTGGWSCSTVSAYVSSTDVLGQALSGLSTSSGGVITASDTILSAFGKLEYRMAQNDAKVGYTTAQAQQDARAALSSGSSSLSYSQSTGVFQLNIGTTAGTLAAGDDSRITGALQRSGGTMTGSLNMGSQDLTYMGNAVMSPDKFFHLSVHSSAPSTSSWGSGERGRMWFNSVTNTIDYWDGS
ncbi:MAG: hypothetical protein N2Z70_01335, partial [Bdellovibrionaceae bacterium]|nr:hypothetical protein [Pseudobdellovibrionaceae bacterium]